MFDVLFRHGTTTEHFLTEADDRDFPASHHGPLPLLLIPP